MRRILSIIIVVLLGITLAWVGIGLWSKVAHPDSEQITPTVQSTEMNTAAVTSTEESCQLLDAPGTTNLKEALAIDSMYQQMPMFRTPVAVVATPDKPFAVGCILPGN